MSIALAKEIATRAHAGQKMNNMARSATARLRISSSLKWWSGEVIQFDSGLGH